MPPCEEKSALVQYRQMAWDAIALALDTHDSYEARDLMEKLVALDTEMLGFPKKEDS